MKNFFLVGLGLISLSCGLVAGVQEYSVTPATLAAWQVTGTDRQKLQSQSTLSLPAGAEIVRTFPGGAVVLYTVSRPLFGQTAADWPVLQVGPAALAFTRQGNEGKLVLLLGEELSVLPLAVALDSHGRSAGPLELAVGYDAVAGICVVGFADQVMSFQGGANRAVIEVSLSAGAQNVWAHDSLDVQVFAPASVTPARSTGQPEATNRPALLTAALEKLQQAGSAAGPGNPDRTASATQSSNGPVAETPPPRRPSLEIYTPPAVRRSAEAVRALIAKAGKN
jgi:hypothetical protein